MTRTAQPYRAPDIAALARLLERTIEDHHITHGRLPGHVEMLNLLARGAGQRNLQAWQAARREESPTEAADDAWFDGQAPEPVDATPPAPVAPSAHARKALQHFDPAGRLVRWPNKLSVQRLAMWVLWTRFEARRVYTEAEVNRVLKTWHLYGDHATLRRELIDHRLLARKSDCSEYRKLPLRPDAEVQGLLQALRAMTRQRRVPSTRPRAGPPAAEAAGTAPTQNL